MTAVIALIVGMLLAGVFIGELHARGTSLRDARHSLARKVSRAHGLHADPRETGPLNVLPTPLLTLSRAALDHNLAALQSWCSARGFDLAPHGKTTMAPSLWAEQLAAGA